MDNINDVLKYPYVYEYLSEKFGEVVKVNIDVTLIKEVEKVKIFNKFKLPVYKTRYYIDLTFRDSQSGIIKSVTLPLKKNQVKLIKTIPLKHAVDLIYEQIKIKFSDDIQSVDSMH